MSEQPETSAKRSEYPDLFDRIGRGEPVASELLAQWARSCFDRVARRPTFPLLLDMRSDDVPSYPPQVRAEDADLAEMATDTYLAGWIFVASRDPGIGAAYGRSETYLDDPYWALAGEAFDFLNDMLSRHHALGRLDAFDELRVRREAALLWEGLSTGRVIEEVGALVYWFAARADVDAIPLGPDAELRRVEGVWAAERFAKADEIPRNRWAITMRLSREYRPESTVLPRVFRRRRPFDLDLSDAGPDWRVEEALDRARLAIHLTRPRLLFTSPTYRLGIVGHRNTHRPASLWRESWADVCRVPRRAFLPRAELAELTAIGSLVRDLSNSVDMADTEGTDLFALALRAFDSSFRRTRWDDRVVDLAVALEALFARTNVEVTHKAATRAALLLGRDDTDSARIYKTVEAFYNLRSVIVHAGPERRAKATVAMIRAWRGADAALPRTARARGAEAAGGGIELLADALKAFLRLQAAGAEPFGKTDKKRSEFVKRLDVLAFDPKGRRALQSQAGIRNRRTTRIGDSARTR